MMTSRSVLRNSTSLIQQSKSISIPASTCCSIPSWPSHPQSQSQSQFQSQSPLKSSSACNSSRPYATVSSQNVSPQNTNRNKNQKGKALNWQEYLELRAKRRTYGLVTTIPTTALAAIFSGSYFLSLEIDPSSPILGLDPLLVYGGATIACSGLGWLLGPTLGNALFNLSNKSLSDELVLKDSDFHERIKKYRPNPQLLPPTMQNRLPDYYAEKVGSIKEYRKWLREQNEFKTRARHGVKEELEGGE